MIFQQIKKELISEENEANPIEKNLPLEVTFFSFHLLINIMFIVIQMQTS